MRARSPEPRSTVVSVGHVTSESALLSMPTSATSPGTSSPALAQGRESADGEQVVRAEEGVRARAFEQPLGGVVARLDHEVVRDLAEASSRARPHERRPSR